MNEQPGASLPAGIVRDIELGAITLCAAFLRAGFAPETHLVALTWEEDYEARESGTRPQSIRSAPLSDPAAVSRIIIEAIGTFPDDDRTFYEWGMSAGVRVGVLDKEGRLQSVVATFDSDNTGGDYSLGSKKIVWDAANNRFDVKIVGIGEVGEPEVMHDCEEKDFQNWSGLTRLVEAAGGYAREYNFPREPGRIANYVFRWGFLSAPVVEEKGDTLAEECKTLGISQGSLGWIAPAHLRAMARCDDDTRWDYIDRVTLDVGLLELAKKKLPICGGNWDLLFKLPGFTGKKPFSYLAPGIPNGGVTLWVGESEGGKSTALHHGALIVATKPIDRDPLLTWLGIPVSEIGHGTVIYLSAEDDEAAITERQCSLGYAESAPDGMIALPFDGRPLAEIVKDIEEFLNVALVIVDPTSSFLDGSIIDDWVASKFMSPLMKLARDKECAVVAVYHLQKNAHPKTPREAKNQMIGSQTYFNNARAVVAMVRDGEATVVSNVKLSDPSLRPRRITERRLRFNPAKKHLVPWADDVAQPVELVPTVLPVSEAVVVRAMRRRHLQGKRMTRTGEKHGVYESNLPELAGMTRVAVRSALDAAVKSGDILVEGKFLIPKDDGSSPLPPSPPTQNPAMATATS